MLLGAGLCGADCKQQAKSDQKRQGPAACMSLFIVPLHTMVPVSQSDVNISCGMIQLLHQDYKIVTKECQYGLFRWRTTASSPPSSRPGGLTRGSARRCWPGDKPVQDTKVPPNPGGTFAVVPWLSPRSGPPGSGPGIPRSTRPAPAVPPSRR